MDLTSFAGTAGGRIANFTIALALAAAGVLAIAAPAPGVVDAIIGGIAVACGIGCIVAAGLSVEEHGWVAFAMILALPFMGGSYVVGLFMVAKAGAAAGAVLLAAAALPLWIALGGHKLVSRLGHVDRPALPA